MATRAEVDDVQSLEERALLVEIRKLRKKLRQIENLEVLDRPLNPEEQDKVDKKSDIRSQLLDKLEKQVATATSRIIPTAPIDDSPIRQYSHHPVKEQVQEEYPAEDNEDNEVVEEISEEMKRKIDDEEETDLLGGGDKRIKEDSEEKRTDVGSAELPSGSQDTTPKSTTKTKKKKKKEASPPTETGWATVKFLVRELEGHNDLVYAVSCQGSTVISGGRDTMVKVWDSDTGAEVRSLGGHTGTVTSLKILPHYVCQKLASQYDLAPETDKLALSGSTDCSVRLWCLNTGETLKSIYTYNSVTCLSLVGDGRFIVTGSDGGKVELWDILSGDNTFTTIGHEDGVTCIKVDGNFVVTSSSDGMIKLWELREQSLHTLYESERVISKTTSKPTARREITSLAYQKFIYYGDDGLNVKALDWKEGVVHKLKHHLGDFGSTGAMFCSGDLLGCAGYDLDNGQAYINFWSLPEEVYLATLDDQDTSRIMALDCTTSETGELRIVTGGLEVKVWDKLSKKRYSPQDAIPIEFNYQFTTRAQESDLDSDDSDIEDDGAEDDARPRRRRRKWSEESTQEQTGWLGSWCTVV